MTRSTSRPWRSLCARRSAEPQRGVCKPTVCSSHNCPSNFINKFQTTVPNKRAYFFMWGRLRKMINCRFTTPPLWWPQGVRLPVTILWNIPPSSEMMLENATDNPLGNAAGSPRWLLRCRFLVCDIMLPLSLPQIRRQRELPRTSEVCPYMKDLILRTSEVVSPRG